MACIVGRKMALVMHAIFRWSISRLSLPGSTRLGEIIFAVLMLFFPAIRMRGAVISEGGRANYFDGFEAGFSFSEGCVCLLRFADFSLIRSQVYETFYYHLRIIIDLLLSAFDDLCEALRSISFPFESFCGMSVLSSSPSCFFVDKSLGRLHYDCKRVTSLLFGVLSLLFWKSCRSSTRFRNSALYRSLLFVFAASSRNCGRDFEAVVALQACRFSDARICCKCA